MRNGASAPFNFQSRFFHSFNYPTSSNQNRYTHQKDFYSICTIHIPLKPKLNREKNSFLPNRFMNFAQKSNRIGCKSLKWRWNSPKVLCYVDRALVINRYFRTQPRVPLNFIINIFPKVYPTFCQTGTSFLTLAYKQRRPGELQGSS